MGRGVELLRVDVGHRGANHRDEGSRDSAFGMLKAWRRSPHMGRKELVVHKGKTTTLKREKLHLSCGRVVVTQPL